MSEPLQKLPTYLATISMVGDHAGEIITGLKQAERKSPARYEPTKQLFLGVLDGHFDYEFAEAQAVRLMDAVERRCAVSVLRVAKSYLKSVARSRVERLPTTKAYLPFGLELEVGPIWVRHLVEPRLLVLHFWETELTTRQLGAAAVILRRAIFGHFPQYGTAEVEFITAPTLEHRGGRKFHCIDWSRLAPLSDTALTRFCEPLAEAWSEYQLIGPREYRRRRHSGGLLG